MADVRLIDAKALLKRIAHHTVHDSLKRITFEAANTYEQVKGDMFNLVQKAPVIDAVEVVRCKDCTYSRRLNEKEQVIFVPQCMVCKNPHGCGVKYKEYDIDGRIVLEHEYCFLGEKRKETKLQRVCPHCGAKMDGGAK